MIIKSGRKVGLVGGAATLLALLGASLTSTVGHASPQLPAVYGVSPNHMPGAGYQPGSFTQPAVALTGQGFSTATQVDFGTATVTTSPCSGPPPAGGCFTINSDTSITVYPPTSHPPDHLHVVVEASSGTKLCSPTSTSYCSAQTPNNVFDFTMFQDMVTVDGFGAVHGVSGPDPSGSPSFPYNIARGVALLPSNPGEGYELDGLGGMHPFGGAPSLPAGTYATFSFDIARAIIMNPCSAETGGYTLDGYGGIHPFGGAPPLHTDGFYKYGWDIAKSLAAICVSGHVEGLMIDGFGGMHPFYETGGSSLGLPSGYAHWNGWDIAREVILLSPSEGPTGSGYTLDGYGGLNPFGGAHAPPSPQSGFLPYWRGWDIARGFVATATHTSDHLCTTICGYTLDGWGGVHPVGTYSSPNAGVPGVDLNSGGYQPYHDIFHGPSAV